ncbi:AAA family ATPase [Weissella diestrammenae]|uniref:AAA family ATPase n=1 Tax=Weissella diestrammenae TaxID=1162633 RepID=A0A7G9T4E6_9LACO|nr:AAA family ATPase [Weissella diestrammenae]MCM0583507.1 AAA family ATPase [Weissella diestrammenae]QNN74971.1 AAA family ATPase [Weissella diestrammenae]
MWIKQAKIKSFGRWSDETFEFDSGLQVVFGLNEAGKTSLHQFISGVLFGYPQARSNKIKTFENQGHNIYGGSLIIETNQGFFEIERLGRTDSKLQVIDCANQVHEDNPEQKLTEILGPLTREIFSAIYSFDQESLLQIYSLKPADLNDHLRRMVMPGAEAWLTVATSLEKETALQMGTTKTAKRPINMALSHLELNETNYLQALQTAPDMAQLNLARQAADEQVKQLSRQIEQVQEQKLQMKQLASQQPIFQKKQALKSEMDQRLAPLDKSKVNQVTQLLAQQKNLQTVGQQTHVDDQQLTYTKTIISDIDRLVDQRQKLNHQRETKVDQQHLILSHYPMDTLPEPLSQSEYVRLTERQKQQNSHSQQRTIGLVIGLIMCIGGMILQKSAIAFIGGIIGVISYFSAQWLIKKTAVHVDYPVEDILKMQPDLRLFQDLKLQILRVDEQLEQINQVITDNMQQIHWLDESNDLLQIKQRFAEINVLREQQTRQKVEQLQLETKIQTYFTQLGIQDEAELLDRLAYDQITEKLKNEYGMIEQQLVDVAPEDMAKLNQTSVLSDETSTLTTQLHAQQQQLAALNYQWQELGRDGALGLAQQKLNNERTEVIQMLQDYFVHRLASIWIQKTLDVAIGDQLPRLIQIANQFLARLTQGRYTEIKYTKTLLRVVTSQGELVNLIDISKGTAEQVYVALRLAFIKQSELKFQFPILIDDAFVDFDVHRRESINQILDEFVQAGYQVVYFTAHRGQYQRVIDLNVRQHENRV